MNSITKLNYADQKLVFAIEKVLDIYFNNDTTLSSSIYFEAAQVIKTLCAARIDLLSLAPIAEKHND